MESESAERLRRYIRLYSEWSVKAKKSQEHDPYVIYPNDPPLPPNYMVHPLQVLARNISFSRDRDNNNQAIINMKIKSLFCLYGTIKEPTPRYRGDTCDYIIEFESEEELNDALIASRNRRICIGSNYIQLYRMKVAKNTVFTLD